MRCCGLERVRHRLPSTGKEGHTEYKQEIAGAVFASFNAPAVVIHAACESGVISKFELSLFELLTNDLAKRAWARRERKAVAWTKRCRVCTCNIISSQHATRAPQCNTGTLNTQNPPSNPTQHARLTSRSTNIEPAAAAHAAAPAQRQSQAVDIDNSQAGRRGRSWTEK